MKFLTRKSPASVALGAALLLGIVAVSCTANQSDAKPSGPATTLSSSTKPSNTVAEKKYEQQAVAALTDAKIAHVDSVASGIEPLAGTNAVVPVLRARRQYTLEVACVGQGNLAMKISPAQEGDSASITCDGARFTTRLTKVTESLKISFEGASSGALAWQIWSHD